MALLLHACFHVPGNNRDRGIIFEGFIPRQTSLKEQNNGKPIMPSLKMVRLAAITNMIQKGQQTQAVGASVLN